MRKLLLISWLLLIGYSTKPQNYSHDFGQYGFEELEMKFYARDPSAEAVVIYDIGKSYFVHTDDGFHLFFERKTKIKIFKTAGLNWAEISIPYYEDEGKDEIITSLKGNTYNMENQVVRTTELNPKNAYVERINEHWFQKKFAMPDVKEGSVIEVSYKIESPYLFNLRNWEFQQKIPVIYSEYTTKMNPFYEYTYIFQGANKFDEFRSYVDPGLPMYFNNLEYQDMIYFFVMKNLPAFRDESFITTPDDYIVKLDFQLSEIHHPDGYDQKIMTTWPDLSTALMNNPSFGKYLKSSTQKGKEILPSLSLNGDSPLDRAKKIDRYVKSNYNWNGHHEKYASQGVKELTSRKTGNSADLNLFLGGLLASSGIDVAPVVISTRQHGKIYADYPFEHFFNDVIIRAKIDNKFYLLDASSSLCDFAELPPSCLNDKGLCLEKDAVEWVELRPSTVSGIEYTFDIKLNDMLDSLKSVTKLSTTGIDAMTYREKYLSAYNDLREELQGKDPGTSDSILVTGLSDIGTPFTIAYSMYFPAESVENKIILTPFCGKVMTENPLKLALRTYPVDFTYKKTESYSASITIPQGYSILSLPADLSIDNNLVKIVYSTIKQSNGTLAINGRYELKKARYEVQEYIDLKGYLNKIVDKFNEKVILIKNV